MHSNDRIDVSKSTSGGLSDPPVTALSHPTEYLQPPVAESRPPWLLVVLLLLLLIALLLLCWLCCYCWKRKKRRDGDDTDTGTANRRRVFEEEGRENKGFVDGESDGKVS